jgi:hypothetical protein
MARESNWKPTAVQPALLLRETLQPPWAELAELSAPPLEQRWRLPGSPVLPLEERSLRRRQQPWRRLLIPTLAASQSRAPAARGMQWPESVSASRTRFVAPGAAREQFSEALASNLRQRWQTPNWPMSRSPASRQLSAYGRKGQRLKNWQRARKRSALQLQLRRPLQWGAAVLQSRHDGFPAIHAALSAAEWRAKHLPAGKCGTNQSSASAQPLRSLQAYWTRTFHLGPGRHAHAGPRLPLPNWSASSSL